MTTRFLYLTERVPHAKVDQAYIAVMLIRCTSSFFPTINSIFFTQMAELCPESVFASGLLLLDVKNFVSVRLSQ